MLRLNSQRNLELFTSDAQLALWVYHNQPFRCRFPTSLFISLFISLQKMNLPGLSVYNGKLGGGGWRLRVRWSKILCSIWNPHWSIPQWGVYPGKFAAVCLKVPVKAEIRGMACGDGGSAVFKNIDLPEQWIRHFWFFKKKDNVGCFFLMWKMKVIKHFSHFQLSSAFADIGHILERCFF